MIAAMTRKKLFRITNELMHAAKEAVLPTLSDAEALADEFTDFFDDKMAKIHQEFSDSPETAEAYRTTTPTV